MIICLPVSADSVNSQVLMGYETKYRFFHQILYYKKMSGYI